MKISRAEGESALSVKQRQFFLDRVSGEGSSSGVGGGAASVALKFEEERLIETMQRHQEEVAWAMDKVARAVETMDKMEGGGGQILEMRLEIARLKEAVTRLESGDGGSRGAAEEKEKEKEKQEEKEAAEEETDAASDPVQGNFIDAYLQNKYDHAYFKSRLEGYAPKRPSDPLARVSYPSKFVYGYGETALPDGGAGYSYEKGGWSEAMMRVSSIRRGKEAVGWHLLGRQLLSKHKQK